LAVTLEMTSLAGRLLLDPVTTGEGTPDDEFGVTAVKIA
jgi:hypothetical protein